MPCQFHSLFISKGDNLNIGDFRTLFAGDPMIVVHVLDRCLLTETFNYQTSTFNRKIELVATKQVSKYCFTIWGDNSQTWLHTPLSVSFLNSSKIGQTYGKIYVVDICEELVVLFIGSLDG